MIASFDARLFRALRVSPRRESAVRAFSRCGEHAACWLALGAAGMALDARRRRDWRRGLESVGAAYVANVLIKSVVRRERPVVDGLPPLIATPTKLSFPSSHASSSFAAARSYSAVLPAGPLYGVAASMAVSRVALGVHYPTDIVAGALLGTTIASVMR